MTCWTKLLQVFNKSLVRKKNYFMGGKCQIHNVKFQDKTISSSSGKNLFSPKIQCSVRSQNVYQALSYNVSVIIFCTASCKVQNVRWLLGRQIITFVCHDLDNFFLLETSELKTLLIKVHFQKPFLLRRNVLGSFTIQFFSSFDRNCLCYVGKYKWGKNSSKLGKK